MEVALGCRVARVTHSGLWTKRGSHQTVGTMSSLRMGALERSLLGGVEWHSGWLSHLNLLL